METINHECYVSLEVAKLLKEAGFNWEIMSFYTNDITEGCESEYELRLVKFDNWNDKNKSWCDLISCSTLDVAQKWLREVKNVILLVDFNNDEDCEENERYGVTIYAAKERIIDLATYPTYEEAQEAGIKKALEIILEKGE